MAKYYAIERSSDYLAHYGVRGMKWGVRKAIASGNSKRLARQYTKAQKRLNKLNQKADSKYLINRANELDKISKKARNIGRVGLGVATVGTGATIGMNRLNINKAKEGAKAVQQIKDRYSDAVRGASEAQKHIDFGNVMGLDYLQDNFRNDIKYYHEVAQNAKKELPFAEAKANRTNAINRKLRDVSRAVQAGGAGIAALGYGTAIGTKIKANALRKKSKNANKMYYARQKANNFKREMDMAFAGTKYAKKRHK